MHTRREAFQTAMPNDADVVPARPAGRGRGTPEWVILALACVGQFMVVLDVSIVNVALPSIGRDLHYSAVGLQWVVNAYVLTFAGFLLLGGRAADLFGRRRVYLFGLVLFAAASLVGGFAQSSGWLTAARAVQGVGGAVLSPATLTIIVTSFSGARLAKALGLWSAVAGAGGAAGVILGGVLTAELSWRWVLFVNVPIGIATMAVAMAFLTESRHHTEAPAGPVPRRRLDVGGAVTVTAGLALLAYAIVGTDQYPWGSARTLGTLAAALVLLAAFVLVEVRWTRQPLVPMRLFRSRSLSGSNLVMMFVGAAFFSMWYFLSLYLQNVLGYGALRTGMAFFPMTLGIIMGAQLVSRLVNRTGVRPPLVAGTLLAGVGFLWLSQVHATSGYWTSVFGPGLIISFALGILFTPLAAAATAGVSHAEAGLASGVLNTSRQVGGSIGLAALATVATTRTRALSATHDSLGAALSSGYGRAFLVAAGLCAVALLSAFIVPAIGRAGAPEAAGATSGDWGSERESPQPALGPETA
jgi:EmrB/QacA subfamily drug resistance transporter